MIAWILGTKLGRWIAGAAGIAAALAVIAFWLVGVGRDQEKARRAADRLRARIDREKSDEDVDRMDPDRLDDEFGKWVRKPPDR